MIAVLSFLWLCACSPSPEKGDSGNTDTGTDTDTDTAAEVTNLSCGLPTPCGTVSLDDLGEKPSESIVCLLDLLAEPVSAEVTVGTDLYGDSPRRVLLALGSSGREVSLQSSGYINGCGGYSNPPEHCTLREAAWFEACQTDLTSECLSPGAWVSGCVTETICPP